MKKIFAVPEYLVKRFFPEHIVKGIEEVHLNLAHKFGNGCTVSEMAESQGMTVFDTALPNEWVKLFKSKTGFNPVGHFVMDYTDEPTGVPNPITAEGIVAFGIFKYIIEN